MVSIVTMAANALGGIIVSALRAFFSLISWFLKNFFNCIKYFFCVLPVTAVVFSGLFVVNIVLLITGSFHVSEADFLPAEGVNEANRLLDAGTNTVAVMYRELISWWNDTVYVLHVGPAYIVLLVVTILMFVPVVSVLLCISVFASYSAVLFGAVCVDAAIYILRLILGKSPVKQIQGRYFLLFRDAGKKHDEKTYEKWLRRHHDEFENDEYEKSPRRSKVDTFYEDEASDDRYEELRNIALNKIKKEEDRVNKEINDSKTKLNEMKLQIDNVTKNKISLKIFITLLLLHKITNPS